MTLLTALTALIVLAAAYLAVVIVRNERWYRYQMEMIDAIHGLAVEKMSDLDDSWEDDYEEMRRAGTWAPVLKVWRSFDSFYPDDWEVLAWRDRHVYVRRRT